MLTIGVLGAAGIAPQALLRPARRRDDLRVVAVASRRPGAAQSYASQHGVPVAFDSYGDLLADRGIDVVYNALPPSEHARWSIAALDAGKHVLCEKPAAMNAAEARGMVEAAARNGRRLLEAFHDHYHPLTRRVIEVVKSGELGQVERIEGSFVAPIPYEPVSIRHDPSVGGGALMDLGCYPVHWLRAVMGEEPAVIAAEMTANPLGADQTIEAELAFASATGRIFASMTAESFSASLTVHGTEGVLEVENPVLPHLGHSVHLAVNGVDSRFTVGGRETYDYQLDALVHAVVEGGSVATEGADIVANLALMDSIYRAAGRR